MRFPLGVLTLALASIAGAAPIFQADFEPGPDGTAPEGWQFVSARGDCSGKLDTEHAFAGKQSARLAIPTDETARAHWRYGARIPIRPDTAYRLSARMMVVNVTGEAYVIAYENGQEVPTHWHDTKHIGGSQDWREYAIEFKTRPDAEFLILICKLRHGTGYAWFDDLVIEETDPSRIAKPDVRVIPEDDGFPIQAMWQPAQWNQHGVFHLSRGHLNPLAVYFYGPDKAAVVDPALVIEATEGISLRGPVVRGRGPMPEDIRVEPEAVTVEGKPYTRWRFPIPPGPMLNGFRGKPDWTGYHHVYADVATDAPAEGALGWRLECAGELGPRHELRVRVSDAIPEALDCPDSFRIYTQHSGAMRHPDPAVRERIADFLATAGICGAFSMTFYEPERIDLDRQYQSRGLELHTWRFEGFDWATPEEARLLGADGKYMAGKICPQAQIEEYGPWVEAVRADYRKRLASGLKRLIIDYEPPIGAACFCARCRKAFAAQSGLPLDECLNLPPMELRDKYRAQWMAFGAAQHGKIVALHCRLIHEIDPEVAVGLCSWHGTEEHERAGGDIRLFDPVAAFHAPMIYTHGLAYHDIVQETCARVSAPVLPFIELADISQPRSLSPAQLRMNILATGLSGGAGAFMWVGMECFDAEYMEAIAQSVREIAALREAVPFSQETCGWLTLVAPDEDRRKITVDGRVIDLFAANPVYALRVHSWCEDDKAMLAVLNYDEEQPFKQLVRLTQGTGGQYEVVLDPTDRRERHVCSAAELEKGIPLEIPPQGLAAMAVTRIH
ncbi:MAG: hypothetical protein HPY44_08290 [Armatimonadetes bacterium]|nr:hypothetical protein [Armatimonadota bacterium]